MASCFARRFLVTKNLLVAALVATAFLCSCGDHDSSSAPTEIALEDVLEEVRTIVDTTRPTRANGDFPGSAERLLETRIWYAERALRRPACRGSRCALILLAHGWGGSTARFDAIGQRLAAAGYIAAAVAFPLTNEDAPGGSGTGLTDVVEQPGDLSVVIDALVSASLDPEDPLYDRVDEQRIAAMGHSLGGTTVVAATRLPCCTDARLKATVYVEPAVSFVDDLFGEDYAASGPPTLTLQGEGDVPVPPEASRAFHAAIEAPNILVEFVGGNHVNLIERFDEEPDPLLDSGAKIMIAFLDAFLVDGADRIEEVADELRSSGHTVVYAPSAP